MRRTLRVTPSLPQEKLPVSRRRARNLRLPLTEASEMAQQLDDRALFRGEDKQSTNPMVRISRTRFGPWSLVSAGGRPSSYLRFMRMGFLRAPKHVI